MLFTSSVMFLVFPINFALDKLEITFACVTVSAYILVGINLNFVDLVAWTSVSVPVMFVA